MTYFLPPLRISRKHGYSTHAQAAINMIWRWYCMDCIAYTIARDFSNNGILMYKLYNNLRLSDDETYITVHYLD